MARAKTKEADAEVEKPAALKGVSRALHVLEYIATHPGRATDIAEGLGLSWATLHRTLQQLEAGGFLQRENSSNRYSIGPRMYFIGSTYIANHRVVELAKPYLDEPLGLKGITLQLVERSGHQSVVLFSAHSDEEITKATYGYHFPLHAGSKGQVLLAYAGEAFIESYLKRPLERLTPATVTDPKELRKTLKDIRERGYAVTIADIQHFTGSMAAPIFDSDSELVAAVCFVGRKSQIENEKKRELLLESLLKIAHSISSALGWRPGSR
jgi:DNA-binding IclR family transcriptional regulator